MQEVFPHMLLALIHILWTVCWGRMVQNPLSTQHICEMLVNITLSKAALHVTEVLRLCRESVDVWRGVRGIELGTTRSN